MEFQTIIMLNNISFPKGDCSCFIQICFVKYLILLLSAIWVHNFTKRLLKEYVFNTHVFNRLPKQMQSLNKLCSQFLLIIIAVIRNELFFKNVKEHSI